MATSIFVSPFLHAVQTDFVPIANISGVWINLHSLRHTCVCLSAVAWWNKLWIVVTID